MADYQFKRTKNRRTVFYAVTDGVLIALSLYLAFLLRFDGEIPAMYTDRFFTYLAVFLSVKYFVFIFFRLYRMSWSYVGFYELLDILKASLVSLLILTGLVFVSWHTDIFMGFPRSVLFIDFGTSIMLIAMFRTSKRTFLQLAGKSWEEGAERTLIVGAGNAGEQIARDMRRQTSSPYLPVGFVDDDPVLKGDYIQGIKVMGKCHEMPEIVKEMEVDLVLISIPSATAAEIRQIISYVRRSSVNKVKIIPGLREIVTDNVSLSDIKEIQIEDLLGREQVSMDSDNVMDLVSGKRVLITGAGGSIGSELVRQVFSMEPALIAALDIDETELFNLKMELDLSGGSIIPVVADVRDAAKMRNVFEHYLPEIVFHAAAYKHVPMMEEYPEEAVRVNIIGTKNVAEAAVACGTGKFVLVSTDKAVRPTNVMGATKNVAEMIVRELNELGRTRFISVRFGNVIGSRGSVIPLFREQIRRGGPVTVTHQDMRRYFMTINEACKLILQSASIGEGGELYHLDMGDQIRILDVARELIRLKGLEPDIEMPIVFTGIRPGEKISEELINDAEYTDATEHPKILKVRNGGPVGSVTGKVMLFENVIQRRQWAWIRNLLHDLVPSYNPSIGGAGYEAEEWAGRAENVS